VDPNSNELSIFAASAACRHLVEADIIRARKMHAQVVCRSGKQVTSIHAR
jgi:hypothetical protein